MKISVIFPVHNQFPLATAAIDLALHNLSGENGVELIVLDNGSATPFGYSVVGRDDWRVVRSEKNTGVYPTFWWGLKEATGDVLAFFHSDLMISEKGWDKRVLAAFEKDPKLGMVGFVGSNELDASGGRGLGTASNFQGNVYKHHDEDGDHEWIGSPARVHGREITGLEEAAIEDGCAMIFRREVLEKIPQREHFPPHHFYDRLLSCEVRERGWKVATLGIACDHISGQTVNQESTYHSMAEEWARANLPESLWSGYPENWAWDATVYHEAERQFLKEYRDEKHFIPCKA